jgi:hypothetical protein
MFPTETTTVFGYPFVLQRSPEFPSIFALHCAGSIEGRGLRGRCRKWGEVRGQGGRVCVWVGTGREGRIDVLVDVVRVGLFFLYQGEV